MSTSTAVTEAVDAWLRRRLRLRDMQINETYAAVALAAATITALVWANVGHSYHSFWQTPASLAIGPFKVELSLHGWVDEGLMTAFFFMVGLDVRRDLTLGELRLPGRALLPVVSAIGGLVGAILAAVLMMAFGWRWADPLVSLFIAALIGKSSIGVLKSALHILMEGSPAHIDHERLLATLRAHEAVISVHDLHLWTITSGLNALSCHIVVAGEMRVRDAERIVQQLAHELAQHGIQHSTIQTESEAHGHSDSLVCACEAEDAHEHHHH